MGQITVEIKQQEIMEYNIPLSILITSQEWCIKHNLDWQKPMYVTPNDKSYNYYIDGWEIEDAEKTED